MEDGAVETHDVVPEVRRGEFLRDHDRTARAKHAAGRDDTAHGMMERQAIVEPVVHGSVREPGKPSTPAENAAMTDVRRLRQPRGARGVDEERASIDRDVAAFGGGQRAGVRGRERRIQIGACAAGTEAPGLRHAIQMRTCGLERIHALGGKDDMIGTCDVDAVGERPTDQPGVDQRHRAADPADAEPAGEVVRPVRHQKADGAAGTDAQAQCPARISVDPGGEFPVGEGLAIREQRGAPGLPLRPVFHDVSEQSMRLGLNLRGQFDGLQPGLGDGGPAPRSATSGRPLDHPCFHDLTMQMSLIDVGADRLPRR